MSISDFKQALREIEGITRVAELADGLLLIDGPETILLVYGDSRRTSYHSENRLAVVEEEFDAADYLLISIEGAVLLLEGTLNSFKISYLPGYLGGVELEGLHAAVEDLTRGTLERNTLQKDHLVEDERHESRDSLNGS